MTNRVLVVGGGIGGLAVALGLRRAGIEVVVLERAREASPVGAGMLVWVDGMGALEQLGVADAVRARGGTLEVMEFRSWRDKHLFTAPVHEFVRRHGSPAPMVIRRADLVQVLGDELGDGFVQFDSTFVGLEQDSDGVSVSLADGRRERCAVLIGADGLESSVRGALFAGVETRYAGYQYLRGITPNEEPAFPARKFVLTYGPGTRFGVQDVGGGNRYWFASVPAAEGTSHPAGEKQDAMERLARFPAPVRALIEATPAEAVDRVDIRDIKPQRRWAEGRATLMGDAAHAMTPGFGRGAGETLVDAVTLAGQLAALSSLDDREGVSAALRAFETHRIARATSIQKISWRSGALSLWRNPLAWRFRDRLLQRVFLPILAKDMERDCATHQEIADAFAPVLSPR